MESTQLAADVERLAESLEQLPEPVAQPSLVVVSGLPSTGKTYFCSKLAEMLPFTILESDALCKVLLSPPDYSSKESSRLFLAVHRLIERLLTKWISLILDATSLSERHCEYLYSIADRLDVKLILERVEAPPEVVHERLESRLEAHGGNSDADWAVYQKMRFLTQKISCKHYAVDTSRDVTSVLDRSMKEMRH